MNTFNTSPSARNNGQPKLFILCLFISLLVHIILSALIYQRQTQQQLSLMEQEPTIVRLVDKPVKLKERQYELDQQPPVATEPPDQASRLAEENQKVEEEQAPKGEDTRDQAARPARLTPAAPPKPARQQAAPSSPPEAPALPLQKPLDPATPERPKSPPGIRPAPPARTQPAQPGAPVPTQLPTLDQLTQLDPSTLERLTKTEQAVQQKIQQREDIEKGDTVWLNLERGMLISFFRRFRNQIEGVWNYPAEAVRLELQGILLLKITVDREGELLDVDLVRSSGSDVLDYEAIQAVYRAAPFGPLPKHYPHPDLKINAHFRYLISGKYIYGRP